MWIDVQIATSGDVVWPAVFPRRACVGRRYVGTHRLLFGVGVDWRRGRREAASVRMHAGKRKHVVVGGAVSGGLRRGRRPDEGVELNVGGVVDDVVERLVGTLLVAFFLAARDIHRDGEDDEDDAADGTQDDEMVVYRPCGSRCRCR